MCDYRMIKYAKYLQDSEQWWHVVLPGDAGGHPPYELTFCDGLCFPENIETIITDEIIQDLKLCPECLDYIVKTANKEVITADDWWGKMWDELLEDEKHLYRKIANIKD